MNIKTRLAKLESSIIKAESVRIVRFIIDPGDTEPICYTCEGLEITRQPNESIEALQERCIETTQCSDDFQQHVFCPIYDSELL